MTTKAILFDLDGTLLDTAPEFALCLNKLLEQEGRSLITAEALRPAVSYGTAGMLKFGFGISDQDPIFLNLKTRFLSLYEQELGAHTTLFPGIQQILHSLEQQDIKWGIVTNKPKNFAVPLIKQFSVFQHAACIVAGDTLATSKPHPAPLLHACQELEVPPTQCWYVGDAHTDVQACRNAGLRCAIANYGYIPPDEDAKNWHADYYLSHAQEIIALL